MCATTVCRIILISLLSINHLLYGRSNNSNVGIVTNIHTCRGETSPLIVGGGGGGVEYSYIRVLPDFFLSQLFLRFILKELSRAEHEYMNIHPPPYHHPIKPLVLPLHTCISACLILCCSKILHILFSYSHGLFFAVSLRLATCTHCVPISIIISSIMK